MWSKYITAKLSNNIDVEAGTKDYESTLRTQQLMERELQYIFHLGVKDVFIPQPGENYQQYARILVEVPPTFLTQR